MFARTYAPSRVPEAVQAWQTDLHAKNRAKLADAVADPTAHPEVFEEGWEEALQREASAPAPGAPLVNGDSGMWLISSNVAAAHTHARWTETPASEEADEEEES